MTATLPRALLRIEGVALFGAAIALYLHLDYSVLALVLLFFAPDLCFVAFAFGSKAGAIAYDLVHSSITPFALGAIGVLADEPLLVQIALIWLAHIGFDRAIGYGLRYPTSPSETHLDRV